MSYEVINRSYCKRIEYSNHIGDVQIVRNNILKPHIASEKNLQIFFVTARGDGSYYEIVRDTFISSNPYKYYFRLKNNDNDIIFEKSYKNKEELKSGFLSNLSQLEKIQLEQLNVIDDLINVLCNERYLNDDYGENIIGETEIQEMGQIFKKTIAEEEKHQNAICSHQLKQYEKDIFGGKDGKGKRTNNEKRFSFAVSVLEYMERNYELPKDFMNNLVFTANCYMADSISIKGQDKDIPLVSFRDTAFFLYESNGKEHKFNKNNIKEGFENILDEKLKSLGINKKQNIGKSNSADKKVEQKNTIRHHVIDKIEDIKNTIIKEESNNTVDDDKETAHGTELDSEHSKDTNIDLSSTTKIVDNSENDMEEEENENMLDDLDSGIISKRSSVQHETMPINESVLALGEIGVTNDDKNNHNLLNNVSKEDQLNKSLN